MNNRKSKRSFTSYQESLFNKYEVDEGYLQNRKQRRACLELLEKIDSSKDFNEKKVMKKVINAFKGTDLHKKIATCMTIASLIMNLQASPVMAAVKSDYNGGRRASTMEQNIESGISVIMDEDSFLTKELIMEDPIENTSIRLVVKKDINSSNSENCAFIDEDSDIDYYHGARILTVIDTAIEDWEMITLGIEEGEMLLLEDGGDPLDEIIAKLEEMNEVDQLNIISHGSSGKLHFEDKTISSETLEKDRRQWETLGGYLSKDGDIQLFGCNVAKGENGRNFIEKLADLTGADIAASINPTGNDLAGGDWKLESVVGHIDEKTVLNYGEIVKFDNVLCEHDPGCYYGCDDGPIDPPDPPQPSNQAPVLGGTFTTNGVIDDNETIAPFGNVTVSDSNGDNVSVAIRYEGANGTLSGEGLTGIPGGYTLTPANVSTVQSRLRSLIFTPTDSQVEAGNTVETIFTLKPNDGSVDGSSNASTKITVTSVNDKDGTIAPGDIIDESMLIDIPTTADSVDKAVDIFDFKIMDGGTSDGESITATALNINVSGVYSDRLQYILSNPSSGGDLPEEGITGSYNSGKVSFDLAANNIVIDDGGSEIYIVKAYFKNNRVITDNDRITISIDGDTDITVGESGTKMAEEQEAVANNGNTKMSVEATVLKFKQEPGYYGESISGIKLDTQPIIAAVDAFGNLDMDFAETITLTEDMPGRLSGDVDVQAVNGIASFTDVVYHASIDGESFKLTANDEDGIGSDCAMVESGIVTSDVIASKLIFATQPSPASIITGRIHDFTTDPVVKAVDSNNVVDTDFTETITIRENGAGSAMLENASVAAVDGVATFTGLTINHDTAETFQLEANDQDSVGSDLSITTSGDIVVAENKSPVLGGTFITNGTMGDDETIKPFESVNVSDENGDTVSIKITYVVGNGVLSGTGLVGSVGDYTLTATDNNQLQTRLQSLVFKPTENQVEVGETVQTIFTITPNDGIVDGNSDNTTKITATSVNDAPKINPWDPGMGELLRYETDNEGKLVSRIVWDSISDEDVNSDNGIAVTAAVDGNGKWQYSLDKGLSWIDIEDIGLESALLLSLEDRVRFVPKNAAESTLASMEYKAWDKTSGNKGEKVDTRISGGNSAFSSQTDIVRVYIEQMPDPYMDISFSESIYGDEHGNTAIGIEDFELVLNKNSGDVKNVEIIAIKKTDGNSIEDASDLTGGEKKIRVFLKITGRPYGSETIEIKPVENSIFDRIGNAMQPSQTTGEKKLTGRRSIS